MTNDTYLFNIVPAPVPEPETWGMMAGLGLIGFILRRRKIAQVA